MTEDEPTFLPLTQDEAEHACRVLRLPPLACSLVTLACVEGKSREEIAETLEGSVSWVDGLWNDLESELTGALAEPGESWARILLAVFRTHTPRDHGPHSAANRYTGVVEEVTVRSPLLDEADLGDNPDGWRVEPVDVLGRSAGKAGRWRKRTRSRS